jgi:hypothetical protein
MVQSRHARVAYLLELATLKSGVRGCQRVCSSMCMYVTVLMMPLYCLDAACAACCMCIQVLMRHVHVRMCFFIVDGMCVLIVV